MVRHTFNILQHLQHNFYSVSDHFGTLCIKGLIFLKLRIEILLRFSSFELVISTLTFWIFKIFDFRRIWELLTYSEETVIKYLCIAH